MILADILFSTLTVMTSMSFDHVFLGGLYTVMLRKNDRTIWGDVFNTNQSFEIDNILRMQQPTLSI